MAIELLGQFTDDGRYLVIDSEHVMPRLFKPYQDKTLLIVVDEYKKNRSSAQNRYFHGVVVPAIIDFEKGRGADWLKNTPKKDATELIKTYIYQNVLKQSIIAETINGMEVIVITGKKMSEMNTEEFSHAVEEIRDFYGALGCSIPEAVKEGFLADYMKQRKSLGDVKDE